MQTLYKDDFPPTILFWYCTAPPCIVVVQSSLDCAQVIRVRHHLNNVLVLLRSFRNEKASQTSLCRDSEWGVAKRLRFRARNAYKSRIVPDLSPNLD